MPTIHKQLLHWARKRGYDKAERFAQLLDERLRQETDITSKILVDACHDLSGTRFFGDNDISRERVATDLASYLDLPPTAVELVELVPNNPEDPQAAGRSGQPPDLFLSYYHADSEFTQRLASEVASEGACVWYDQNGMRGGRIFPKTIETALSKTRYVGVVATEESLGRPWVEREVYATFTRESEEGRDILIPIRIDDSDLNLFTRMKQWCDFRDSFSEGLECLIDAINLDS